MGILVHRLGLVDSDVVLTYKDIGAGHKAPHLVVHIPLGQLLDTIHVTAYHREHGVVQVVVIEQ